tara:strand:+ start:908 stop:1735 length:828 start_codon:yes stop_codon:yes gene_type:complete
MDILDNKYKREGIMATVLFHVVLLLLFLFVGLTHMVPAPEQGVLINFGNSEVGSGNVQPDQSGTPDPVAQQTAPETTPPTPSEPTPTDPVATQDNVETVEVPETKETPSETKPTQDKPVEEEPIKEEPEPEPQISNQLNSALDKFKKSSNQTGGSEGDDQNQTGDKGQENGVKEGGAYSGNMGGGGNGDYNLGNRKALTKPRPSYTCQEEGVIVVEVRVDRNGKTLDAKVTKGTTNYAQCLTSQAIKAAMETKWQSKPDAPYKQIGTITYRFMLN